MAERQNENDGAVSKEGQAILGEVLGDRYAVVEKLGAGAFGEVYRAKDNVLARNVAIKRIRLDAFADASQLEQVQKRFEREAQVAAQLRHPNIVTTHDIVAAPAMSFIVMELVEGETHFNRLRSKKRLGLEGTIDVLSQVASALDHAHQSGIVHRDVKPANIMIEPSGHVKVMDFGIAKLDSGTNLTATGSIVGTPNYMSPEQARGEKVDGRSDLFSLGCILYECLSGEKAFKGESITAILMKVLTEEPSPLDVDAIGLPPALREIARRALDKNPEHRFESGDELIGSLKDVAEDPTGALAAASIARPTVAAPTPVAETKVSEPAPVAATKKPSGKVAAAVAIALLAMVGILWGTSGDGNGTADEPAAVSSDFSGGDGLIVEQEVGFIGKIFGREPQIRITVPADTDLEIALDTALSSETAEPGDRFSAALANAIAIEGVEALPAGSSVAGHVSHAASAGKVSGVGELTLELDQIELPDGTRLDIQAAPLTFKATRSRKKDAGIVGGLAGVGAVVGGVFGGSKGAAVGAAAGGGAGAGVVLNTKGNEVVLEEGAALGSALTSPIAVTRAKPDDS